MNAIKRLKQRAKELKTETYAIYLASKDPRVPWYSKAIIIFTVAHTFSPIDLIPDFIPVLGYLDDLIITPLGIWLALKTIPDDVLTECREEAQKLLDQDRPTNWFAAGIIITIWIVILALVITTVSKAME